MIKLKEIRSKKGLTQAQISEKLACSTTVYSRYETGNRQPSIETLIRLSEILNVSIDHIVGNPHQYDFLSHPFSSLSQEDVSWLNLLHELPPEEHQNCFAYMRGFVDGMNRDKGSAPICQEKAAGES